VTGCVQAQPSTTASFNTPEPQPVATSVPEPDADMATAGDLAAQSPVYQQGKASYYGQRFAGRSTASGEPFNPKALTAAHRSLPFGTRLRVTNLNNGRQTVVRVNDRGPFAGSRIIDVSLNAARKLGMLYDGVVPVRLQVLN